MKTLIILKSAVKTALIFLTLSVTLFSCLKKSDEVPQANISGLSLIHASPMAEKFDIYLGQTKVNRTDFAFTDKIDYLNAYSGIRQITLTKKDLNAIIKSENFTLKPQTAYSLFVIDKLDNIGLLFLTDTLTNPLAGKAKIRFVNLSPDAGALNLAIDGASTDLVSDKLFKEYSSFIAIDKADRVTFNIKNKTTGAIEVALSNIKIEEGKIYTLWVKGLKSASDDYKLGAEIYTHK